jgi:transcriptional regulator with XRE-family HTH domain
MQQSTTGDKVARLRSQKGMTQKELADLCNVDIRTIQRIESGEVEPRTYTIKLLANALAVAPDVFRTGAYETANLPAHGMKTALMASIVFSINAFLVVYYLLNPVPGSVAQACCILVHAVSGTIFFKGFYLLGRCYNNKLMEIASMLSMVLFPLTNALYLLQFYSPFPDGFVRVDFISNVFMLLCIGDLFGGVGLVIQSNKNTGNRKAIWYKLGGVLVIVPSVLYFFINHVTTAAGLLISLCGNLVLAYVLYMEQPGADRQGIKEDKQQLLA